VSGLKVVRFLSGEPSLAAALGERWARALASGSSPDGRPMRVAVCEPLSQPGFPAPGYAAVDLQWFADPEDAWRNEGWVAAAGLADDVGTVRLVVEEVVARGGDYLDARWSGGGERLKMMSFGRRNPALTPGEFSARWRGHAGSLGGATIPEDVRGLAYVQDHPVPVEGREWPLDAVNEVTFERLDDLRRRRDWFAARPDAAGDLMSPTEVWSLFVRERLISSAPPGAPPG
jgi:hypothetical protein